MPAFSFRTITKAAYWTDGGSITLWLRDEHEGEHELVLAQSPMSMPNRRLGGLYLDDRLIAVRSPEEAAILAFLDVGPTSAPEHSQRPAMQVACVGEDLEAYFAAVKEGPAAAVRHLAKQLAAFVRSDTYLALAAANSGA